MLVLVELILLLLFYVFIVYEINNYTFNLG